MSSSVVNISGQSSRIASYESSVGDSEMDEFVYHEGSDEENEDDGGRISRSPSPLTHPEFPTSGNYPSFDELRVALKHQAASLGFTISTTRSHAGKGWGYLGCSLGGRHRTAKGQDYEMVRKQAIQSRRNGCPFKIRAWRLDTDQWTFTTADNTHNHPPSQTRTLSSLRKLTYTADVEKFVRDEVDNRVRPRQILKNLAKQHPAAQLLPRDIQNIAYARRAAVRTGHTATEACILQLRDSTELHKPFLNQQRQLVGLVFTTPTARALLHRFPTVLSMDCTYKTNQHGLPMLHISGFSSTNQTFTCAVAFLSQETTSWYSLALAAFLDLVDPSRQLKIRVIITDREVALIHAVEEHLPAAYRLTCLWHLGENIELKIKSSFEHLDDSTEAARTFRDRYLSKVVRARTEAEMNAEMDAMDSDHAEAPHQRALQYVRNLLSFKERFVAAFTDDHPHLGQRNNSRLEGNHAAFKAKLGSSKGDLYFVLGVVRDHLEDQWIDIKHKIGFERTITVKDPPRILSRVRVREYCERCSRMMIQVKARISRHALKLVTHQLGLADKYLDAERQDRPVPVCNLACKAYGVPCAHIINALRRQSRLLRLQHFHSHWRLGTEQELEAWVQIASDRVGAVDTAQTILYEDNQPDTDDEDAILDPPLRLNRNTYIQPSQPSQRSLLPLQATVSSTEGARTRDEHAAPTFEGSRPPKRRRTLPSGRIATRSERVFGVPKPPCAYCGSCKHKLQSCRRRRADRIRDAEDRTPRPPSPETATPLNSQTAIPSSVGRPIIIARPPLPELIDPQSGRRTPQQASFSDQPTGQNLSVSKIPCNFRPFSLLTHDRHPSIAISLSSRAQPWTLQSALAKQMTLRVISSAG